MGKYKAPTSMLSSASCPAVLRHCSFQSAMTWMSSGRLMFLLSVVMSPMSSGSFWALLPFAPPAGMLTDVPLSCILAKFLQKHLGVCSAGGGPEVKPTVRLCMTETSLYVLLAAMYSCPHFRKGPHSVTINTGQYSNCKSLVVCVRLRQEALICDGYNKWRLHLCSTVIS